MNQVKFLEPEVSVVIPCLNEEEGLETLLPQLKQFSDEILVIDNGSTDRSARVAHSLGAEVIYDGRRSYGLGYQRGLGIARGKIIATMDGDGTYPPSFIPDVIKYMNEQGIDFVNCSRFPLDNPRAMPRHKYYGNKLTTVITRRIFKYDITDALSGMWVFRRNILSEVISERPGMEFSLEIKLNAIINPLVRFGEYHISYHERNDGMSKFRPIKDSLRISLLMLRFWRSFHNENSK